MLKPEFEDVQGLPEQVWTMNAKTGIASGNEEVNLWKEFLPGKRPGLVKMSGGPSRLIKWCACCGEVHQEGKCKEGYKNGD